MPDQLSVNTTNTFLAFTHQMDALWASGEAGQHVDEAVLSGRTTAFNENAKIHIGIPWMTRYHEQIYTFDISKVHSVVSALKGLVAPPAPPAPAEGDDSGDSE